jgi:NADPH-dependent glutamate synthase beta subunit-like oxidoreductase
MPISTRLPDLEQWKAQVKCKTACPVATDAGRYVQLIAEGRDEEAFLVARAPNAFDSTAPISERFRRRRAGQALYPWEL